MQRLRALLHRVGAALPQGRVPGLRTAELVLAAVLAWVLAGALDTSSGSRTVLPDHDQGAWQQHGALLAAVDRLRIELEATVRPGTEVWRPVPLVQGPRDAVHRAVTPYGRRARRDGR